MFAHSPLTYVKKKGIFLQKSQNIIATSENRRTFASSKGQEIFNRHYIIKGIS